MSQRAVEQALGKLLTDERFRESFFGDPAWASRTAGLDLSADEMAALRRISPVVLQAFSERLDDRICRLLVPGEATLRVQAKREPAPTGAGARNRARE